MALGDNTYNNNDQQFRPTVYGYSLYNTDNDYEKSRLTFTMWARTIKISIEEMTREAENGRMAEFDTKNSSIIYLTPSKAYMLAGIVEKYYKNPEQYSGYGVASARAFITISREGDYDVIRINEITGTGVRKGLGYVINTNYNIVTSYDDNGPTYNNEMFANMDFIQIITQLKDYAKAMDNTIAFTVMDQNNRNTNWLRSAVTKIAAANNINLSNKQAKPASGNRSQFAYQDEETDDLDSFLDD